MYLWECYFPIFAFLRQTKKPIFSREQNRSGALLKPDWIWLKLVLVVVGSCCTQPLLKLVFIQMKMLWRVDWMPPWTVRHVYGENELHVYVYMEAKSPSMGVFLICLWHGVSHWCLWLASKLQGSTSLLPVLRLHICTIRISCVGVGIVYTCVPVCGSQKSMLSSSIMVYPIFFWNCLTLNLELANLSWLAAELIFLYGD